MESLLSRISKFSTKYKKYRHARREAFMAFTSEVTKSLAHVLAQYGFTLKPKWTSDISEDRTTICVYGDFFRQGTDDFISIAYYPEQDNYTASHVFGYSTKIRLLPAYPFDRFKVELALWLDQSVAPGLIPPPKDQIVAFHGRAKDELAPILQPYGLELSYRFNVDQGNHMVELFFDDPVRRDCVSIAWRFNENTFSAHYTVDGKGDDDELSDDSETNFSGGIDWDQLKLKLPAWMARTGDFCPDCDGEGWIHTSEEDERNDVKTDCPTCRAAGRVRPSNGAGRVTDFELYVHHLYFVSFRGRVRRFAPMTNMGTL